MGVNRSADLLGLAGIGALSERPVDQIKLIDLDKIIPNAKQSRTMFIDETIQSLATSIEAEGLISPIVVRPREKGDGHPYELVSGERRWRAFKLLKDKGLEKFNQIQALVRTIDDQSMRRKNLIENIEREDLSVLDLARTYSDLKEEYGSVEEVAKAINKSRSLVHKYLRVAEASDEIKDIIRRNNLDLRPSETMQAIIRRLQSEGKTEILDTVMAELKSSPVDSNSLWEMQAKIFGVPVGLAPADINRVGQKKEIKDSPLKENQKEFLWQFVKDYEHRLDLGDTGLTAKEKESLSGKIGKFLKALGARKVDIRF
jgi:ParB family chromosome partitioning protein